MTIGKDRASQALAGCGCTFVLRPAEPCLNFKVRRNPQKMTPSTSEAHRIKFFAETSGRKQCSERSENVMREPDRMRTRSKQLKITIVQGAFFPVPPLMGGAVEKVWFTLGRE